MSEENVRGYQIVLQVHESEYSFTDYNPTHRDKSLHLIQRKIPSLTLLTRRFTVATVCMITAANYQWFLWPLKKKLSLFTTTATAAVTAPATVTAFDTTAAATATAFSTTATNTTTTTPTTTVI